LTKDLGSAIAGVSDTALWVAYHRGLEGSRSDAAFQDELALVLAGERGRKIALSMPYCRMMTWVMAIRTAAIDRLIQHAIEKRVDTVVNLGAGLDTRPYRMKLPKSLRWIEVDFPDIIELKKSQLSLETPVCSLERVSLDFSDRQAARALYASISAGAKKVLVITEGVIPYLTNEQAADLSADLLSVPQFEYWIQDYRDGGLRRSSPRSWKKLLKDAPFRFNAKDWIGFFTAQKWTLDERITVFEQAKLLKRPYPFMFPWSLLFLVFIFLPKKKRMEFRNSTGYCMLRRSLP
jgi:methyltransferase (TIGR00027 family)